MLGTRDESEPGADTGHLRSGRRRATRVVLLKCALLVVVVAIALPLVVAGRVWYVARQDHRPRSDAIVVLGAAQYNGRPSPVLRWRLEHAVELYRDGVAPAIVTVGGSRPGDRYSEAGSGKRWLAGHGVPATRVIAVTEGSDTARSMLAVGGVLREHDWRSAVLVTDPWHALRVRAMAGDAGIEATTSPTRSGPVVQTRDTQARYIARETAAYLYYLSVERWRNPGEGDLGPAAG